MRQQLRQDIDLRTFEVNQTTYYAVQLEDFPQYWVTTSGHVISTCNKDPHVLADRDNGRGYMNVRLTKDGRTKEYTVHRLVARAYLESPADDREGASRSQVNHINGVKSDNKVANLEFTSARENIDHHWQVVRYLNKEQQEDTHANR